MFLLFCRKSSNKDEVTLNLEPHRSREALDLVKLHLRQLAGIPSMHPDIQEPWFCPVLSYSQLLNINDFIVHCSF